MTEVDAGPEGLDDSTSLKSILHYLKYLCILIRSESLNAKMESPLLYGNLMFGATASEEQRSWMEFLIESASSEEGEPSSSAWYSLLKVCAPDLSKNNNGDDDYEEKALKQIDVPKELFSSLLLARGLELSFGSEEPGSVIQGVITKQAGSFSGFKYSLSDGFKSRVPDSKQFVAEYKNCSLIIPSPDEKGRYMADENVQKILKTIRSWVRSYRKAKIEFENDPADRWSFSQALDALCSLSEQEFLKKMPILHVAWAIASQNSALEQELMLVQIINKYELFCNSASNIEETQELGDSSTFRLLDVVPLLETLRQELDRAVDLSKEEETTENDLPTWSTKDVRHVLKALQNLLPYALALEGACPDGTETSKHLNRKRKLSSLLSALADIREREFVPKDPTVYKFNQSSKRNNNSPRRRVMPEAN